MCLEIGADDYITKPFSLRELLARIKAIFRRVDFEYDNTVEVMKKIDEKKPNELVREKMNLSEDEFIVKLVWVRYGNDEALIYETIYLNYSLVKGIENINLKTKKLYDVLNEEFGIKITHGKEMFYPCKLNTTEAKYLELAEGDLGMKVERTTFQGDKVLEYTKSTVRGDKFIYMTTFSGNNHY